MFAKIFQPNYKQELKMVQLYSQKTQS